MVARIRVGIDHDADGFGDGDERNAGSDPNDAASTPSGVVAACVTITPTAFKRATLSDARGKLTISAELLIGSYAQDTISAVVIDGNGPIVGDNVPGAAIVAKGSGFRFTAPPGATGITRVTVREKRNSDGFFKITLKTNDAWAPGAADEGEATTIITLNVGGTCFRGNATRVN